MLFPNAFSISPRNITPWSFQSPLKIEALGSLQILEKIRTYLIAQWNKGAEWPTMKAIKNLFSHLVSISSLLGKLFFMNTKNKMLESTLRFFYLEWFQYQFNTPSFCISLGINVFRSGQSSCFCGFLKGHRKHADEGCPRQLIIGCQTSSKSH